MSVTALRRETSAGPDPAATAGATRVRAAGAASNPLRSWAEDLCQRCWTPVVDACLRLRVHPNAVTAASAALVCAAAVLLAVGALAWGGGLFLLGASLDLVDGRVARASGAASRAGAFLDSTLDRVGELAIFAGLAVHFRGSAALGAVLAASAASVLVSYARARGEALGAGASCRAGLMQRPERVALVGLPCALSAAADALFGDGAGGLAVAGALWLTAALTAGSAARRCAAIYRALRRSGG